MGVHFVGGVNGVGKSSLVERVCEMNPYVERIHTTSRFMSWLGVEVGDYDALRALPDDYKMQQNQLMLQSIVAETKAAGSVAILDSHFLTLKRGEISAPLLDGTWLGSLGSVALIAADTGLIAHRLQQSQRDRQLFAPGDTHEQQLATMREYQQRTHEAFEVVVGRYALPYIVIENNGDLDTSAQVYASFITNQEGVLI